MGFIGVAYSPWLGYLFSPKTGCGSSLNLVLEFQKIPGQLVVFSPHWNTEEVGFSTGKGMPQQ